jgi:pyridoxal phosphate enzyme (YggS family)
MTIAQNISAVREKILAATRLAGRDAQDVELMAVTKTVGVEHIREAYQAGIRLFGENRVQEFESKNEALRDFYGVRWHMIGHLQSNKAARAAQFFASIESVDSLRIARRLNDASAVLGKILPVLIEINIGGEQAKSGVAPDSEELEQLLRAAPELPNLAFQGLMTVPPYAEDPERSRPFFRKIRELANGINARKLMGIEMSTLSMGMSHDFEVAIEEGATRVRLGTAIFGERQPGRRQV